MLPTFPRHTQKKKIMGPSWYILFQLSPENNHQAASPFLSHLLHPSELYHSYSRSICVASCLQFLLCPSIYIFACILFLNLYMWEAETKEQQKIYRPPLVYAVSGRGFHCIPPPRREWRCALKDHAAELRPVVSLELDDPCGLIHPVHRRHRTGLLAPIIIWARITRITLATRAGLGARGHMALSFLLFFAILLLLVLLLLLLLLDHVLLARRGRSLLLAFLSQSCLPARRRWRRRLHHGLTAHHSGARSVRMWWDVRVWVHPLSFGAPRHLACLLPGYTTT